MSIELLPNFAGDPNSARDILEYLTDPTNAGLLDLDQRLEALTAIVALKVEHVAQEAAPTSAESGWFWTKASTGVTYYCHTAYAIGEPAPDTKWTAVTDNGAVSAVKALAQITSPTPQVGLLTQTISGFGTDLNISVAEKATVKILYDEMVQRKIEIDVNAVRYSITGEAVYTDYVTSYNALVAYMAGTGVLTNLAIDTIIGSSSAWTTAWSDALVDEGLVTTRLRQLGQDLLDTIDGNTTTALAQLADMTADGIISPQEKLRFRDEWTRVQDEYVKLSAQATEYAQTGATAWTTLAATYSALSTYLGATTSVFSNMTTSTTLSAVGSNATEWQTKWQAYYTDAKVFDAYIDTYFNSLLDAQDASLQGFISELSSLANDGVISGGTEKQSAKRLWNDITRLHAKILYQGGQYSVATPASYTTAYDDLNTYLNTTADLFTDLTDDTAVTRSVYNSKFDDYYFQYDSFTDLVVLAQKSAVDSDPADYEDYKALVDSIVNDGIISAGMEKTRFNAIWLDIQATQAIIVASGAKAGASTTGLVAAYNDLSAYIGTLTAPAGSTPNFTIEGEDTAIGVSTFYSKMRAYESAKATLESDIISQLIELQAGVSRSITDINDDGIVSVSEKNSLYKEWLRLTAEKAQLDAQADLLSITTEKTNMDSAYTTLETYLNGLNGGSGVFNDLTTATTLSTPEKDAWDGHWNLFFTTKATLETTIIATIQGNTATVGTASFRRDGTSTVTGNFVMSNYKITGLGETTLASAIKDAATVGQVYTEQQARILHEGDSVVHGVSSALVGVSDNQTLTTKTINADNNTISELEADNFKTGVIEGDVQASVAVDDSTIPSTLATKTAINAHSNLTTGVHGATGAIVGTTDTQTLTNKTIDADTNPLSNLETDNFKAGAIVTTIGVTGSDAAIPTEQAVREAIDVLANRAIEVGSTAETSTTKVLAPDGSGGVVWVAGGGGNGTKGAGTIGTSSGSPTVIAIVSEATLILHIGSNTLALTSSSDDTVAWLGTTTTLTGSFQDLGATLFARKNGTNYEYYFGSGTGYVYLWV